MECLCGAGFLLGDFIDGDQTLHGTVQHTVCKGSWQVVWDRKQEKQMRGMMADGRRIHAVISQLEYVVYLFFLFKATSMYLVNTYLSGGFMISIKPGSPNQVRKIGQWFILSSAKLPFYK